MNKIVSETEYYTSNLIGVLCAAMSEEEERWSKRLFNFLYREDMGGNKGIHKIKENDSGRNTI